ncbi:hypothetical protein SBOR_4706 [Sclerotinia borealis F-4128]|uniref:Uncharacterized protein n=1 Tax=Sclerotinia borealis (strain F-4128) TaxID=1432307 RepID=W9CJT3_SCLBF|nr:hypothetical protein SBOR_4706 [Sclerotinia borealis F-4128]
MSKSSKHPFIPLDNLSAPHGSKISYDQETNIKWLHNQRDILQAETGKVILANDVIDYCSKTLMRFMGRGLMSPDYFVFSMHAMIAQRCFPHVKFPGKDPDPVFVGSQSKLLRYQADIIRRAIDVVSITDADIHHELTGVARKYNKKLAEARAEAEKNKDRAHQEVTNESSTGVDYESVCSALAGLQMAQEQSEVLENVEKTSEDAIDGNAVVKEEGDDSVVT